MSAAVAATQGSAAPTPPGAPKLAPALADSLASAREAVQWLYFAYLGAVKEQNGAAMSLGRTSTFLDVFLDRDLEAGRITESEAQEIIDDFVIKLRIVRFLRTAFPEVEELVLFDLSPARLQAFAATAVRETGPVRVTPAASTAEVLAAAALVAFATTAASPHVAALPPAPRPQTILNVSLRDLAPEVILAADNVVDDVDHVCRAETSVHLAERASGSRGFIRCTLADVLEGRAEARGPQEVSVFSPFGLGVLDLAVANLVWERARAEGVGTPFGGFFPDPWDAEPAGAAA